MSSRPGAPHVPVDAASSDQDAGHLSRPTVGRAESSRRRARRRRRCPTPPTDTPEPDPAHADGTPRKSTDVVSAPPKRRRRRATSGGPVSADPDADAGLADHRPTRGRIRPRHDARRLAPRHPRGADGPSAPRPALPMDVGGGSSAGLGPPVQDVGPMPLVERGPAIDDALATFRRLMAEVGCTGCHPRLPGAVDALAAVHAVGTVVRWSSPRSTGRSPSGHAHGMPVSRRINVAGDVWAEAKAEPAAGALECDRVRGGPHSVTWRRRARRGDGLDRRGHRSHLGRPTWPPPAPMSSSRTSGSCPDRLAGAGIGVSGRGSGILWVVARASVVRQRQAARPTHRSTPYQSMRSRSVYAIVKTGGKQHKVAVGDELEVERGLGAVGASVSLPCRAPGRGR